MSNIRILNEDKKKKNLNFFLTSGYQPAIHSSYPINVCAVEDGESKENAYVVASIDENGRMIVFEGLDGLEEFLILDDDGSIEVDYREIDHGW